MTVLMLNGVEKSYGSDHKKVTALKKTDFHADRE